VGFSKMLFIRQHSEVPNFILLIPVRNNIMKLFATEVTEKENEQFQFELSIPAFI